MPTIPDRRGRFVSVTIVVWGMGLVSVTYIHCDLKTLMEYFIT